MSHPAVPAFQSNALPTIFPLSRLELTASGPGRITARSRRGALPTQANGAAVLADLGRKLAPVLRAARADLAAVAR